ncbi:MAG: glycosyltransferase [Desulfobacteraceae bacterium]|jgi:glycosyltransferase involved in cell wall biosynthesis
MKTAVVIPVKNEREGMERLILSLISQVSENDEIIFVDAGSTDGTREIIEEYTGKNRQIKLYQAKDAFPGKGRNIAIRNTDADIIAQIDGGNLPAENWLKEILEPIKNGTADYVTGNIHFMPIKKHILGKEYNLGNVYGVSLYRELRGAENQPPAGGASVAYKRYIWEKAGGFPDWLRFGSDPLFVKKVMQQDIRTVFAENAIVYWQIGPSFMQIMKRFSLDHMAGIRTWKDIWKSVHRVLIDLILVISILFSLIIQTTWYLPLSIFVLLLIKRVIRSMSIYTDRVHEKTGHNITVFFLYMAIESMGIFSRIAGTIRGLLAARKNRVDWEIKVKKYLAS